MKITKLCKYLFLIILPFLFVGCAKQAPITNRNQFIIMSESQEIALGEKSYNETLKKSKLSSNVIQTKRVRSIGKKIASIVNRSDYKWEFNLVENKEKNAFCLPGGKVVVFTGILDVAKNDSQLATVMSHEIAHALARHGAERVSLGQTSNIISKIGNIVLSKTNPEYVKAFNKVFSAGSKYALMLPYGRMQESEADEIGIHLMKTAGYNINEALNFWKNMSKGKKEPNFSFLSTHPSSSQRIDNIQRIIKKIN